MQSSPAVAPKRLAEGAGVLVTVLQIHQVSFVHASDERLRQKTSEEILLWLTCRTSSVVARQKLCICPEASRYHSELTQATQLHQQLMLSGSVHYLEITVAGLTSRLLAISNKSTAACRTKLIVELQTPSPD